MVTARMEVDLVKAPVGYFGFERGTKLKNFYARIINEFGLQPCLPEVAPRLRRECREAEGSWFLVGSEPMLDAMKIPRLFVLTQSVFREFWLNTHYAAEDTILWVDCEVVLTKRRI